MQLPTGSMFLQTYEILPIYLHNKHLKLMSCNYVCICIHELKPTSQNKEYPIGKLIIISNY